MIIGEVSGVVVDDAGTKYEVGDVLTFTASDSNTSTATGFVSIIDGSIALNGTDKYSTDGGDFLVFEDATTEQEYLIDIELETATEEADGQKLLLNGTDGDSLHAGHSLILETTFKGKILTEQLVEIRLQLKKEQILLVEYQKYFLRMVVLVIENFQQLQLHLLQVQVQALLATTDNIGSVGEVEITNAGFAYVADPAQSLMQTLFLKI